MKLKESVFAIRDSSVQTTKSELEGSGFGAQKKTACGTRLNTFHGLLTGKRQAVDKPPKEQKYLKDNKSPQTRFQ